MPSALGLLLALALLPTGPLSAFRLGFEAAEGFPAGPAYGTPAGSPTAWVAAPVADSRRFLLAPGQGLNGSQALQMVSTVTKNYESLLRALQPADYGEAEGPPRRLFRIGVSVRRTSPLLTNRFDPDLTFEWGSAGDFRLVKLRAASQGELLVHEHHRIMPTVIPGVFGGGLRRIEALVDWSSRTYRLFLDGQPALEGRPILFGSPGAPPEALQVGFSALILGPVYVFDDFSVEPEPDAPLLPPPPDSLQPDDLVSLPADSLPPYNLNPTYWMPGDADRRLYQGSVEINWYVAFTGAYRNLPAVRRPDGTEVPRLGENLLDPARPLAQPEHPRLFFPDLPVVPGRSPREVLLDRAAHPALAGVMVQVRRQGQSALDSVFPPVMPNTNPPEQTRVFSEDPLRGQCDLLYWLALDYLTESAPARRDALRQRLLQWIDLHLDWGSPAENLPLGHSTAALAVMYDWFYHDFLADDPLLRKRLKYGIAQRVRFRNDWANRRAGARNPISPPAYNHAWFNNLGPGMAGLALWGEHDAGLPATEIQGWLVEALNTFLMQQALQPSDGATVEGWSYEDYGHRPVFDFLTNADSVLGLSGQLLDSPANRQRFQRLFFLTPKLTVEHLRYGDGFIQSSRGGSPFHWLARRFRDPRSQLLGNLLNGGDPAFWPLIAGSVTSGNDYWPLHWRSLFWFDPDLPPAAFADLPLHHRGEDYGLCSARSGWDSDGSAALLGFRCGLSLGETALRLWNGSNYYNNHAYPAVGHVTFFDGPVELLPTTEWLGVKWSGYFNLAAFAPRDGQTAVNSAATTNVLIGQVNEIYTKVSPDVAPPYTDNFRPPRVIHSGHHPGLHTYLMEMGGVYKLVDHRNTLSADGNPTANRRTTYPVYHRRVVFLPDRKVLVVADRIRTFYPRQPTFLVPTRALQPVLQISAPGHGTLDFASVNGTPDPNGRQSPVPYDGRLVFFSPDPGQPAVAATQVPTSRDADRQTFSYTLAADASQADFGFAVGTKEHLAGLTFALVDAHLLITGLPEGEIRLPLTDEDPAFAGRADLADFRLRHFHTTSTAGASADDADPDGDGAPNLLEFAVGFDPTDPASSPGLAATGTDPAAGFPRLELRLVRAARQPHCLLIPEFSSSLTSPDWSSQGTVILQDDDTLLRAADAAPLSSAPGAARYGRWRVQGP